MPVQVPEDHADAEGPNASLDFGQATQMSDLQRQAGLLATGGNGQAPGQPEQPGQAGPPGAQPQAAAPVQAAPPTPNIDFPPQLPSDQPPNTRYTPWSPDLGERPPWRTRLNNWASHPDAGPYLKMLASIANAAGHPQTPQASDGNNRPQ